MKHHTDHRLLFICKSRIDSYGICYGLVNSATFLVNYLNSIGIESKVVSVKDNNAIDREVYNYKPTHVFIEALWVVPPKFEELLPLHKKCQWYVRLHSKAPFLSNEGIAMKWLTEYKQTCNKYDNFHLSTNNEEFNSSVNEAMGLSSIYLPNIYSPLLPVDDCISQSDEKTINIGCFGAIRPLKNHLIQALAAIIFADRRDLTLNFHINSNRIENGESTLRNLKALFEGTKHNLIEHPWVPHHEFIKLVRTMDMGMQVSLSESFNIVTADFVACNKPIVVSPDIDWMSNMFKANPNSTEDIINVLNLAWASSTIFLHKLNNLALHHYNKKAQEVWQSHMQHHHHA